MKSRFIIQFSGYHENGCKTDKKYLILNIEGEVTMDIINKEIEKLGGLSPFRRNKDIDIHYMQAF
jgi:hypothetical protein